MVNTIFWDFDGVILNSLKIKGDGFVELFQKYKASDIKAIELHHYENIGISRFEKIKYFYNHILGKDISEEKIFSFSEKFSDIIKSKVFDRVNLIQDSLTFIKRNYKTYNFHIVSSAEHDELNKLCEYFKIKKYFITINGSPVNKDVIIKNLLKKYSYDKNQVILIGDAINDYNVAKRNKIEFYGYNNNELKKYGNYIQKFEDFKL